MVDHINTYKMLKCIFHFLIISFDISTSIAAWVLEYWTVVISQMKIILAHRKNFYVVPGIERTGLYSESASEHPAVRSTGIWDVLRRESILCWASFICWQFWGSNPKPHTWLGSTPSLSWVPPQLPFRLWDRSLLNCSGWSWTDSKSVTGSLTLTQLAPWWRCHSGCNTGMKRAPPAQTKIKA